MNAFTMGRWNRREYWIAIAIVLALAIALAFTPIPARATNTGITVAWLIAWGRRLHDIGRSAWWGMVPLITMIVIVVAALFLGGPELRDALGATQAAADRTATEKGLVEVGAMFVVVMLIQFGFTLWLGIKRGDPEPNAWGAPRA